MSTFHKLIAALYQTRLRPILRKTPGINQLAFALWRRVQDSRFRALLARLGPPVYDNKPPDISASLISIPSLEAIRRRDPEIISEGESFSDEMARVCYTSKFLSIERCAASTGYQDVYARCLKHLKGTPIVVLEIGIGVNDPTATSGMGSNHLPGSSLRGWAHYFSSSEVHGADVDRRCLVDTNLYQTHFVDQLDAGSLRALMNSSNMTKPIDIIVDDGLHTPEANANTLVNLLPYLSRRGIYVCEDISDEFAMLWQQVARMLRSE